MSRLKKDPKKINFKKVMEKLDWTKEINPVTFCKAVNLVENCTSPKDKYHVGEVYFNPLKIQWESWLRENHPEVVIRTSGKDTFYKMPEKSTTTEQKKIKKEYVPPVYTVEEEKSTVAKSKVSFPDDEAINKVILMMKLVTSDEKVTSDNIKDWKSQFGWKDQRYCGTKKGVLTLQQEVNEFLKDLYGKGNLICKKYGKLVCTEYDGAVPVEKVIEDCKSLSSKIEEKIDNLEIKKKILKNKPEKEEPESFDIRFKKHYVYRYLHFALFSLQNEKRIKLQDLDVEDVQTKLYDFYRVVLSDEEILEIVSNLDVEALQDGSLGEKYSLEGEIRVFQARIKRSKEVLQKAFPTLSFRVVKQLGIRDSIFEIAVDLGRVRQIDSDAAHLYSMLIPEDDEVVIPEQSSKWLLERIEFLSEVRYF